MGARIVNTFELEFEATEATGGGPWSVVVRMPSYEVIQKLQTDMATEDTSFALGALQSALLPYLGEPQGFDPPVSWADIKEEFFPLYFAALMRVVVELQGGSGEKLEAKRKNSSCSSG